jgi:autotransporter-associated beta strand protein
LNSTNQLLSAGQAGFGIEATSIADDGDFIGAGHKVVTNSFTSAGVPAGVARRFARSWAVQVNDTNDNLGATLAFDYSDAGLSIGTASSFKLLRSLDGGATWNDVGPAAIVSGDQIKFNVSAAQLSNGLYTLGDASGPQLATSPGNTVYAIGGAAAPIDNALTLAQGGSPTMTGATVTVNGFSAGNADVLAFTPVGAITGSFSTTTGILTLSGNGTAAEYQQALRSVTFFKASYQGLPSRTITYAVTDQAAFTSTATRGVLINATAAATDIFWDGNSDGDGDGQNWNDPNNWTTGVVPDSNDTAVFQNNDPGLVSWFGDVIVGGVRFTNTSGLAYALDGFGGTLSLTNGGVAQIGTINNSLDVNTVITPPATALTFTIAAGTTLTVSKALSGPGDLVKNGAGTVALGGTNTYTGSTFVNAGILRLLPGGLVVPPVPAGAALEYTFDGGNGNNTGSTGATNNANLVGPATVVGGGLFGNKLNTPYSARMELANTLALGTNWTLSAWWQDLHPTGDWRTLFRNNGGGDDHEIIVQAGTNNLGMYDNATGGAFRDSGFDLFPASDGIWHHLAAVGNDITNTTQIYIDGVLVGTSDRASAGNLFWIGGLGGGQTYANYLD